MNISLKVENTTWLWSCPLAFRHATPHLQTHWAGRDAPARTPGVCEQRRKCYIRAILHSPNSRSTCWPSPLSFFFSSSSLIILPPLHSSHILPSFHLDWGSPLLLSKSNPSSQVLITSHPLQDLLSHSPPAFLYLQGVLFENKLPLTKWSHFIYPSSTFTAKFYKQMASIWHFSINILSLLARNLASTPPSPQNHWHWIQSILSLSNPMAFFSFHSLCVLCCMGH